MYLLSTLSLFFDRIKYFFSFLICNEKNNVFLAYTYKYMGTKVPYHKPSLLLSLVEKIEYCCECLKLIEAEN